MRALHHHIMGTEGEADFLVATFGVQKLGPWEHEGASQELDFETQGVVVSFDGPGLRVIG
jgi:hypothetical protein